MDMRTQANLSVGAILIIIIILFVSALVNDSFQDSIIGSTGNCTYIGNNSNDSLNNSADCPINTPVLVTATAQNTTLSMSAQTPTIGTIMGVTLVIVIVIVGLILLFKKNIF